MLGCLPLGWNSYQQKQCIFNVIIVTGVGCIKCCSAVEQESFMSKLDLFQVSGAGACQCPKNNGKLHLQKVHLSTAAEADRQLQYFKVPQRPTATICKQMNE